MAAFCASNSAAAWSTARGDAFPCARNELTRSNLAVNGNHGWASRGSQVRRRCSSFLRPMPLVLKSDEVGNVRRSALRTTCMAENRRVRRVAEMVKREISNMFLTDKVLRSAVSPEEAMGVDRSISSMASVTDVEVSNDLQVAKVYISLYGDERSKDIALANLTSKAGYVRSNLGKAMRLRITPEVRFVAHDGLVVGAQVLSLLDKLRIERERKARAQAALNAVEAGADVKRSVEKDFEERKLAGNAWDSDDLSERVLKPRPARGTAEIGGVLYVGESDDSSTESDGEEEDEEDGVIYIR